MISISVYWLDSYCPLCSFHWSALCIVTIDVITAMMWKLTGIEPLHHHVMATMAGGRNNWIWSIELHDKKFSFLEKKTCCAFVMASITWWCNASIDGNKTFTCTFLQLHFSFFSLVVISFLSVLLTRFLVFQDRLLSFLVAEFLYLFRMSRQNRL